MATSRAGLLAGILAVAAASRQAAGQHPLLRRYGAGDSIAYLMRATNIGRADTVRYDGMVAGHVERDSSGQFIERLSWSRFHLRGADVRFASAAAAQQSVSLDATWRPVPDVSRADPRLIGPILDLFTFYVDLKLAAAQPSLARAGDHASVPLGLGGSWADGKQTLVAQDAIDFDLTLDKLDPDRREAIVIVRHVPPASLKIRLPAAWMSAPVAATPNNWVEVSRAAKALSWKRRQRELHRDVACESTRRTPARRVDGQSRRRPRAGLCRPGAHELRRSCSISDPANDRADPAVSPP